MSTSPLPTPPRPSRLVSSTSSARSPRHASVKDGPGQRYADWSSSTTSAIPATSPSGTSADSSNTSPRRKMDCLEAAHTALTFLYHDVLSLPSASALSRSPAACSTASVAPVASARSPAPKTA